MLIELRAKFPGARNHLPLVVENVPQQNRGEDCGLFSIAYPAFLCNDYHDPAQEVFNQVIMRQELIHSLQVVDMFKEEKENG